MQNARNTDPITSHEAGRKAEATGAANGQREACLAAVKANPGSTAAEIAGFAGLERHAASRRLPELRARGLVYTGAARVCSLQGTRSLEWHPVVCQEPEIPPTATDGPASSGLFDGQPEPPPVGWGKG